MIKRGRPLKPVSRICPLRKPCEVCDKPYGRKLRTRYDGYQYLEHISLWHESRSCSNPCKRILQTRTRLKKMTINPVTIEAAMRMFCL